MRAMHGDRLQAGPPEASWDAPLSEEETMLRQRVVGVLFILVAVLSLVLAVSHPQLRALRLALGAVFLFLGVRFLRGRRPPSAP